MDNIKFQYYPASVYKTTALGTVTLSQFLQAIKTPRPEIESVFTEIAEASKSGDLKRKDYLKQNHLFSFTPSVLTDGKGRRLENIISLNPIMVVEFDKIDFAEELKKYLFDKLKCVVAAYISPSGGGCKFIIRIKQPTSIENYKEYFCGLAYHLSKIVNFDSANYNIILPHFLTIDKNILIREWEETEEWAQRGGKINAFKVYEGDFEECNEEVSEKDKEILIKIVTNAIESISDNAHTKVRGTATILGGYVASNYMSIEEAEDLICGLIEDNDYCKKNIRGYHKTAKEFIRKGMSSPLKLDKYE